MSNMTFAQKALARAAGKDYVEIGEASTADSSSWVYTPGPSRRLRSGSAGCPQRQQQSVGIRPLPRYVHPGGPNAGQVWHRAVAHQHRHHVIAHNGIVLHVVRHLLRQGAAQPPEARVVIQVAGVPPPLVPHVANRTYGDSARTEAIVEFVNSLENQPDMSKLMELVNDVR